MEIRKLKDYTRGWFVGPFEPSLYDTEAVEVAVKEYSEGDREAAHYHKEATEITVIVEGSVRMNNTVLTVGDIAVVNPEEVVEFEALTNSRNVVVKLPAILGDKYTI